ncbi:MAG: GDP-mannose-dependent alpha-(1-2)-phosphatidylinositol mannosyltransferase [Syntrophorhabdus sp. PtaB.Bin006]|nr:MAG: GDP-mannose-dependent alpha-(1-2)-phosphatidylinositol mannosyltransferase [Syntrophorhabdus sp. PtaB.Bin006]OPY66562.1 MAG: GDP-mannose-dependent alpha-(1-2)-phosphatidylinositol mannosyltransferase [Syntrophorhabdus sp. PtaU1.Bin050]
MKIGYFIRNLGVSGGVKVVLQHVRLLRASGHDAVLITENVRQAWELHEDPIIILDRGLADTPYCDVYVGTVYSDVKRLYEAKKGKLVHLCQGYEPLDYLARIKGESITERYQRKGFFSFFERQLDILKFRKRIRKIESVYRLPTIKAAVSKYLVELIGTKFGNGCAFIQNGIDLNVFHPDARRKWGENGKIRLLSVGSMHVACKKISDTLDAVRVLKEKKIPVEFVRVSGGPPSVLEKESGLVDTFYTGLSENEMAELYRTTDIFISSSLEGEGFGLPPIEAMASGVPSILTEIPAYRSFCENKNFAYFVPTHRPDRIVEGVLALSEDNALRQGYIERGFVVAKSHSLERTRLDLAHFFEEWI